MRRSPKRHAAFGAYSTYLVEVEITQSNSSAHCAVRDQTHALDEYHERLDFAERVLTQREDAEPRSIEPPAPA